MSSFRYQAEFDPADDNNSQALVVDLVGMNRRVLDVGCAAGDVGRVLTSRGCEVVGIEPDSAAANVAKHFLAEVVVGAVDELDLISMFGAASFDAIVVADVLEHVAAPGEALRRLIPLLKSGGSIVASIPNVAHGSVRLALLNGSFDYTEVGLLDRTHLRFFTLAGVEQLFADAGLDITDLRRTKIGIFETHEIPLRREDFSNDLIDTILSDPEASTYQFVLRATPDSGSPEVRAHRKETKKLRDQLHASERALAQLKLERFPRAVSLPGRGLQVGLWGNFDTVHPADLLRLKVHRHEIGRRSPSLDLRSFSPFGRGTSGVVMEELGPPTDDRIGEMADELDAVVIIGELSARSDEIGRQYGDGPSPDHPATFLLRPLKNAGFQFIAYSGLLSDPVPSRHDDAVLLHAITAADSIASCSSAIAGFVTAAGGSAALIPDPLRLVPRLSDPRHRARLRRNLVAFDAPYVLIRGSRRVLPALDRVRECLHFLHAAEPDLALVFADVDGGEGEGACNAALAVGFSSVTAIAGTACDETVSLVEGAMVVITDSEWLLELARAFHVRTFSLAGADRSPLLSDSAALVHVLRATPPTEETAVQRLDLHFEQLTAQLLSLVPRERPAVWPVLGRRLESIDRARAQGNEQTADANRALIAADGKLVALLDEVAGVRRSLTDVEERTKPLQEQVRHQQATLNTIYGSRLWRWATRWRRFRGLVRELTP